MSAAGFQIQLFATGTRPGFGWRLLSGNNREVGRNAAAFPTEDACRVALLALQGDIGELRGQIRRAEPNHWTWELRRDGQLVAVAGHPFDRQIRCEQGLSSFVLRFAEASVSDVVTNTAARRFSLSVRSSPAVSGPSVASGHAGKAGIR